VLSGLIACPRHVISSIYQSEVDVAAVSKSGTQKAHIKSETIRFCEASAQRNRLIGRQPCLAYAPDPAQS